MFHPLPGVVVIRPRSLPEVGTSPCLRGLSRRVVAQPLAWLAVRIFSGRSVELLNRLGFRMALSAVCPDSCSAGSVVSTRPAGVFSASVKTVAFLPVLAVPKHLPAP